MQALDLIISRIIQQTLKTIQSSINLKRENIPSHKAREDPQNRVLVNPAKVTMERLVLMNSFQTIRFGNGS